MIYRSLVVLAFVAVLAACGGSSTPATAGPGGGPTAQPPGAATPAPGGGGNTGDLASVGRQLMPPGSTQVSEANVGNAYQLILASNSSLQDLAAFYTQQIPALGLTETGRFDMQDTLTIALANPDGGIVITPGNEAGTYLVTISLGTSS